MAAFLIYDKFLERADARIKWIEERMKQPFDFDTKDTFVPDRSKEDWPKKPTADQLKACAVSIDDLEVNTGLDFFCNLPDVIEDEVESSCNVNDWAW